MRTDGAMPLVAVFSGVALAFAGLMAFAAEAVWFPLAWLVTGSILVLALVYRFVEEQDRHLLVVAAVLAIVVRAWFAWWIVDHPDRNPDSFMYWASGSNLGYLLFLSPRLAPLDFIATLGTHQSGYFFYTAVMTQVQRAEILVCFTNVLIGSLSGLLVYRLARHIWPESADVARWAALLTWASSAIIVSDAVNMRDSHSLVAGMLVMLGVQRLSKRWDWPGLLLTLAGFLILLQWRSYIAFMLLPTTALILFVARRSQRLAMLLVFGCLAGLAVVGVASMDMYIIAERLGHGLSFFDMLKVASLGFGEQRQASSAVAGVSLDSWGDLAVVIPLGVVRALFAPIPWMPLKLDLLLIPDGLVRYALMPFMFAGIVETLRRDWRRAFPALTILAAYVTLYAIIEIGGNIRHNLQYYPLYFMLSMIGIRARARYGALIWTIYAAMTLALWVQGMSFWLFKTFGPVVFAALAVWWVVETRAWRPLAGMLSQGKALRGSTTGPETAGPRDRE